MKNIFIKLSGLLDSYRQLGQDAGHLLKSDWCAIKKQIICTAVMAVLLMMFLFCCYTLLNIMLVVALNGVFYSWYASLGCALLLNVVLAIVFAAIIYYKPLKLKDLAKRRWQLVAGRAQSTDPLSLSQLSPQELTLVKQRHASIEQSKKVFVTIRRQLFFLGGGFILLKLLRSGKQKGSSKKWLGFLTKIIASASLKKSF